MSDSWPGKVWTHWPFLKSQSLVVASQAPEMKVFLSLETDIDVGERGQQKMDRLKYNLKPKQKLKFSKFFICSKTPLQ